MRLKLVESTSAQFEFSYSPPNGFGYPSPAIFGHVLSFQGDGWDVLAGLLPDFLGVKKRNLPARLW
jgi:hypothetical protein